MSSSDHHFNSLSPPFVLCPTFPLNSTVNFFWKVLHLQSNEQMKAVGVIWPRCICRSIKGSRSPSPSFLLESFAIGSKESVKLHEVQCFSREATLTEPLSKCSRRS